MIREGCLQISENEILRSTLPLREISVVLIANPAVSLSGYVLAELAEQHIPLICCSASFLPVAFLNPLTGKAEREPVFQALFQASEPFKKQIWQALIRSKIAGQAFLLKTLKNSDVLFPLIKKVRSGDTGNTEAYAAAIY